MGRREGLEAFKAGLKKIGQGETFFDWVSSLPLYLKGQKFSFDMHPETIALYQDMHPNKVIRKAAQTTISTYAMLFITWRALKKNARGVYYGPTNEWAKKFSTERFDKILKQIPDIKLSGADNVFMKEIGTTSIQILGLDAEINAATVDADTRVVDEACRVNPANMEESHDRLEHSSQPMSLVLSKPEAPGQGIDALFSESDQRYYLFKCPACGQWNNPVLTWPKCCMPADKEGTTYHICCKFCAGPLDARKGEWVPMYPDRTDCRGYQFSHLYWTWKKDHATELMKTWKKANNNKRKKRFWTGKIGVPWAGKGEQITDAILTQNQGDHPFHSLYNCSFMGVDQGDLLHIAIGHLEGEDIVIHYFEETDDFGRLDKLMINHNVWCCVIDLKPNTHDAKKFAIRNEGFAWVADYIDGEEKIGKAEKDGKEVPKIMVSRDESLDETVEAIIDRTIILPRETAADIMDTVRIHLKNLRKEKKESPNGKERQCYIRGENHFGMAINYMRIATTLQNVMPTGLEVLPAGASFYQESNDDDDYRRRDRD
jgi:hypothetical protein